MHLRTSLYRRRTNIKLLTKKRMTINKIPSPKGSMKRLLTLLTMIAFLHWREMVVIDIIASVDILSSPKILNQSILGNLKTWWKVKCASLSAIIGTQLANYPIPQLLKDGHQTLQSIIVAMAKLVPIRKIDVIEIIKLPLQEITWRKRKNRKLNYNYNLVKRL